MHSETQDATQLSRRRTEKALFQPTLWVLMLALALCGCATQPPPQGSRTFNFQTDTFSFPNQLVWEYYFDEHGKWTSRPRQPAPDYSHHCFVVARSARQFFEHAKFDPKQPIADTNTYRQLIRQVVAESPHHFVDDGNKIVIPGYADLRSFSAAQEGLLKQECGGAWHSYFQHGHWRIMIPFTRHHQEKMAAQLVAAIKANHPPIAHLICFPQLKINHAVVLYGAQETPDEIRFTTYDPNNPKAPVTLIFNRKTRSFQFPANDYFPGGWVDVYEVYRDWRY